MAIDLLVNATTATVTTGGTTAPAGGTVEAWTVTCTSTWPTLATGQQYRVIDQADIGKTSGYEVMIVTANAIGTGVSWTVTRGVENTTPYAHAAGWTAVPAPTAGGLGNGAAQGPGTLLGFVQYAPTTNIHYSSASPTFAPVDSTNLTVSFVAPPSGAVVATSWYGYGVSTAYIGMALMVHGGALIGVASFCDSSSLPLPPLQQKITGLTPGTTYQLDLAFNCWSGSNTISVGSYSGTSYSAPAGIQIEAA